MIEIPEATVIAKQIHQTLRGRAIASVVANHSPHRWAWFYGDPEDYAGRLCGKAMKESRATASAVELALDDAIIVLSCGTNIRYHPAGARRPKKHQLLLEFDDGSALSVSIQMYGELLCLPLAAYTEKYGRPEYKKPHPLTAAFSRKYFTGLFTEDVQNLSVKAFLATEQRIPGLGNGVLQDILYNASLHPRRKIQDLSRAEVTELFQSIKSTLREMTKAGGRDTDRDLFGEPGGYATKMSRNTVGQPCTKCCTEVQKESYLGGTVYYCPGCQPT